MDGSDSITVCDHCQDQFDSADIYDVDGNQLCEGCKRIRDNGGWISVKDRYPHYRDDVLIRVTVADTFNIEQGRWIGGDDWVNCWCSRRGKDLYPVTHWQPLPQPPQ